MLKRRDFLKAGLALAAGGCASPVEPQETPPLFPPKPKPPRLVKGVIWIHLDGAVSPFETWDPKPGRTGSIATSVDGIRISERLPRCAQQMKHLSILRTVIHQARTPEDSAYLMHCGLYPSCWDCDVPMGSLLAFEVWKRNAGIPPFLVLDAAPIPQSDTMGETYVPVYLKGAAAEVRRREGADRWMLLAGQDRAWTARHQQSVVKTLAERRAQSEDWMNSMMLEAMDPSSEPVDLLRDYGPGFGKNCLLARRLIQAGAGVVEVGLSGWDRTDDTRALCSQLDAGLGTLVRDLAEKDLLQDVVVFCAPSRGQTPKGEPSAEAFSVVMAGGHLAGGRVYGDTGPDGDKPVARVPLWNLFATLCQACGIDPNKKYETLGRKNKYVSQGGSISTSGHAIQELF